MNLHDFIFSNDRRHRLTRHITFWLCWLVFSGCVQLTGLTPKETTWKFLVLSQPVRAFNRLIPQLLFCYFIVYFLVPRFIPKKKYKSFAFYLLLSVLSLFLITYLWFYGIINPLYSVYVSSQPWSPFITKFFSFYSNINFTGAIPACCVMLTIKYYKDWYKKQKQSEILLLENTQAELQLLKAQVHPHFLFNTLNNIYSFALTESPRAAELVDKLSGMIDYMTTEGEKSFVALEKEIKLIEDYIGLEKVRYGDRLNMHVEINGDYKNKIIAPLLMIPFVENCFKHGASKMRGRQWIKLVINVHDNLLNFNLSNSKPEEQIISNNKKGIGLNNVSKRLQLLYPANHILKIESTNEIYQVYLQVSLQEKEIMSIAGNSPIKFETKSISYV